MVHNRECRAQYWRNSPWTDIASQEKIDAAIDVIGLPRTYRGPIIWDYEPYVEGHWTSDGRIVWTEEHKQKAFDAYLLLLERGRNRLPNAAHAVFGLPTILVRDPSSGTVQKPTSYWEPVLRECDFIAHQCYSGAPTFNNWQRQQLLSDLSDMRSVFPDTHICTIVHPRVAYDEEPTEMHDPIELRWRAECALDSWANSVCLWTGELRPWEPPMLEEFMAEFLKDLPGKTPTVPTIGARP